MRKWSKWFLAVFLIEGIIFIWLISWIFTSISSLEVGEQIKTISYVIGAFASTLITTALVYHGFIQEPELGFTGFLIEPKDLKNNTVAKEDYIEYVNNSHRQVKHCYSRGFLRKKLLWVKIVECNEPPKYLRIANDITNLGFHETYVHEIQFEQTYPKQEELKPKKHVEQIGRALTPQVRDVRDIKFPSDFYEGELSELKKLIKIGGRLYRLKFTSFGATMHCSKEVWLNISEDMKTIEWSESKFKKLIRWTKSKDNR
ncbi:MAG: hypothetical protein EMLJLAPB_01094 [Candidatus Argoarchaeum ethanivorans]|uniref:Uncharacterized protein n=1 Tax=Candidatus Argoarchaeum ethanivorans TaxID=2608793 RepID=A0A811TKN8_9EURY|nr:MAG: hypothetical protein EMLJLAPB_01094 [Candidatus Argoarchaeum ethanivorans]